MNDQTKVRGRFRIYLQWPVMLSALWILLTVAVSAVNLLAGIMVSAATLIYMAISLWLYFTRKKALLAGLTEYARRYASAQMRQMDELLVPYAVVDETGRLVWMNQEFSRITETGGAAPKTLMSVFPQVTKEQLQTAGETITVHDSYGERNYRIDLRQLEMDPQEEEPMEGPRQTLTAVCLSDETQILKYRQQINDQKMVAGLIYLDNYDEALESVEEVRRSLLIALIDRKINKYISSMNGIVKKLEKDKYFFAVKQQYMLKIQEDHFSILEEVKTVNIGNEMAVTLSIGIGMNGDSYSQNYEYARTAIDMALGRGGGQAVV